jgi:hypothetical protein
LFLCGKQAFCNYYYLVAFVVLVGLVAEDGLYGRVGAADMHRAPKTSRLNEALRKRRG